MAREDLTASPDGATLRHLASGLEIVRRRKHEPVDLSGLTRDQLRQNTDKRAGSKFTSDWSLEKLVVWVGEQVERLGWAPGTARSSDITLDSPVGHFVGKESRTIRIISDGRYVHAFPVEDPQ